MDSQIDQRKRSEVQLNCCECRSFAQALDMLTGACFQRPFACNVRSMKWFCGDWTGYDEVNICIYIYIYILHWPYIDVHLRNWSIHVYRTELSGTSFSVINFFEYFALRKDVEPQAARHLCCEASTSGQSGGLETVSRCMLGPGGCTDGCTGESIRMYWMYIFCIFFWSRPWADWGQSVTFQWKLIKHDFCAQMVPSNFLNWGTIYEASPQCGNGAEPDIPWDCWENVHHMPKMSESPLRWCDFHYCFLF